MKFLLLGVAFITGAILFTSCQRELDGNIQSVPAADTVLIKSVIYFDTTKSTGLDTVSKIEYYYDANKRLIKDKSIEYQYSGTSVQLLTFSNEYFYLGNGILPYQSTQLQSGWGGIFTTFYTYNNNFVIRDSTCFTVSGVPNQIDIETFSASASGEFLTVEKKTNPQTGIVSLADSVVYKRDFVNGNIVNGFDTTYLPVPRSYRYHYTYDNNKNPFSCFSSSFNELGSYYFNGDSYLLPVAKNNAISFSEYDLPGPSSISGNINYTYRTDGYPLTGLISGFADANKIIFSYYN